MIHGNEAHVTCIVSSSCPHTAISSTKASEAHAALGLIDRPFRDGALALHALKYLFQLSFDHDASHYHFSERGVECFEVEDQVQLAHVFEKAVEGQHKDLDEIEEGQRGLG